MSVSVSKTLLFPTLTNIKFSDLRTSFKEVSTGSVSASELRRNTLLTGPTSTNPIVPDATENAAVSTANDLKISQFQNTIKYYDLNQTGTDLNLDVGAQTWNFNLFKNIKKRVYITGTCGSNSTSAAALSVNAITYNVFLIVSGSVLGAGGAGGTSTTGGNGGPAMSLVSSGNAITVVASGSIYGGGGGGAKGANGGSGPPGTCYYFSDYNTDLKCGNCPGCAAGYYSIGCNGINGCNCGKRGCGSTNYQTTCRLNVYYNTAAPAGGTGGDGGPGRGYNYPAPNSLAGSAGTAGALTSCSPNYTQTQTQGATGETGGSGGDWGNAGGTTTLAAGGASGAAITGSGYSISADSITTSFKGSK